MDSQCQQNTPAPTHALGGEWVRGNLQGQCTANLGFAATPYLSGSLTGLSLPDTGGRYKASAVISASRSSLMGHERSAPLENLDRWCKRALSAFGKLKAIPMAMQVVLICIAVLALFSVTNLVYQILHKPT
jgi:hypothetical protein